MSTEFVDEKDGCASWRRLREKTFPFRHRRQAPLASYPWPAEHPPNELIQGRSPSSDGRLRMGNLRDSQTRRRYGSVCLGASRRGSALRDASSRRDRHRIPRHLQWIERAPPVPDPGDRSLASCIDGFGVGCDLSLRSLVIGREIASAVEPPARFPRTRGRKTSRELRPETPRVGRFRKGPSFIFWQENTSDFDSSHVVVRRDGVARISIHGHILARERQRLRHAHWVICERSEVCPCARACSGDKRPRCHHGGKLELVHCGSSVTLRREFSWRTSSGLPPSRTDGARARTLLRSFRRPSIGRHANATLGRRASYGRPGSGCRSHGPEGSVPCREGRSGDGTIRAV